MNFIHKLEPIWWMLFGGGGFVAGFFLPGLIISVLLLGPSELMSTGLGY
jgi:fumarate reductase subunit D